MSTRSRRVAALAALVLALVAPPAAGQDPNGDSNLGEEPPVQLGGGRDDRQANGANGGQAGPELADTGAESLLVGLAGLGLLLAGTGLRLRVPGRGH